MQRYDEHFLHMELLSHDNKPHNIHTNISYASPEKKRSISRNTRSSRRQMLKNQKGNKVNESKQCMERGLQEEPVGYGVMMPSPWRRLKAY